MSMYYLFFELEVGYTSIRWKYGTIIMVLFQKSTKYPHRGKLKTDRAH